MSKSWELMENVGRLERKVERLDRVRRRHNGTATVEQRAIARERWFATREELNEAQTALSEQRLIER